MWSAELWRLPQFDGISLRVMQTSEAPNVGIRFRVFDFNSCRSELDYHFVEVMHSKVHHPDFLRVPEILGRFGKGTEDGWSGLLLPNGSALARLFERDPQVLQVPVRQRFGITSSEEQPSNSGYFFHFRSSRFMFSSEVLLQWRAGRSFVEVNFKSPRSQGATPSPKSIWSQMVLSWSRTGTFLLGAYFPGSGTLTSTAATICHLPLRRIQVSVHT